MAFSLLSARGRNEVARLISNLYIEDNDPTVTMTIEKIHATFSRLATYSDQLQLDIFTEDDQIIGYALLYSYWSNEHGGSILNIDELYVVPEYRRRGIAARYISDLIKQRDLYTGITLSVLPENDKALRLYQRLGFIPEIGISMLKLT